SVPAGRTPHKALTNTNVGWMGRPLGGGKWAPRLPRACTPLLTRTAPGERARVGGGLRPQATGGPRKHSSPDFRSASGKITPSSTAVYVPTVSHGIYTSLRAYLFQSSLFPQALFVLARMLPYPTRLTLPGTSEAMFGNDREQ